MSENQNSVGKKVEVAATGCGLLVMLVFLIPVVGFGLWILYWWAKIYMMNAAS